MKGDADAALACFDQALAINPQDFDAYRNKGVALAKKGDEDAAIACYDRALAINPQDFDAYRNKGVAHSKKGDADAALACYDRALAINSQDFDALRNKGIALSKKSDKDAAIACFDQALAINPQDFCALRNKGVALSKKGDEEAALACFNQALAINPQDFCALRNKGVALSKKGDEDAALACFNQALAINPQDYDAYREKGVALSKKGDADAALACFDQALAINPQDYDAYREKGVALAYKGNEDAAFACFNQALAINPQDYDALRNKGIALYSKDDEDAALTCFNQALAINPQDYNALRNKGIALYNKGDEDAAFACFNQALAINPKDDFTYREKSVCAFNSGNIALSFTYITKAVELAHERWKDDFRTVCSASGKDFDEEWHKIFPEVTPDDPAHVGQERLPDIRGFIGSIRTEFGEELGRFLQEKAEAEAKRQSFLSAESLLDSKLSLLMILRKWNSYTPALPTDEDERSRGGGYFIWHGGKGYVIDPGYNFIENFYDAGGRMHDINAIILTHAHNDHTNDFESICMLLYEYNAINDGREKRQIRLYVNNGAFLKFSGILNLRDHGTIDTVVTLNAHTEFSLADDLALTVLPAYHDELLARDQSIGLLFTFNLENDAQRQLAFTSDTGLYPLCPDHERPTPNAKGPEVWEQYPRQKMDALDVLVTHIGSIKPNELEVNLNEPISTICYPNHLGIIGASRMITMLRPRLAVISEFGEEMRTFRCPLVRGMQTKVIDQYFRKQQDPYVPRVVPGDLPFIYDILQRKFYSCIGPTWEDVADIAFEESKGKDRANVTPVQKRF